MEGEKKPEPDLDIRDDEIAYRLIDYHIRIFENLAEDSLSILGTQLLAIPVSISVISLFATVMESQNQESPQILNELFQSADSGLVSWGIIIGTLSVCVSGFSYYVSRRSANKGTNLLIKYEREEEGFEESLVEKLEYFSENTPEETAINRFFSGVLLPVGKTYSDAQERYGTSQSSVEQRLTSEFDGVMSLERNLRSALFLSLAGSLVGMSFILIGVSESIASVIDDVVFLVIILFALLLWFPYLSVGFSGLERILVVLNRLASLLIYTLESIVLKLGILNILKDLFRFYPEFYTLYLNSIPAILITLF